MTRTLFMVPLPPPITGQSVACQSFLDALREAPGHEVDVINTMKGQIATGMPWRHAFRLIGFAWRGRKLGRRADVIYMNPSQSLAGNIKDLMLLWALGRRNVAKIYWHLHGGGIRKTVFERSRLLAWLNRRQLSRMRGLVVEGERLRAAFAGMTTADRIHVVPNFAGAALYLEPEEVEAKFARPGPIEVLYLSNFNPDKGCIELLEAAEALHRRGVSDVRFVFAGGFESETQEAEVTRRVDALPNARLLGVVKDEAKRDALAHAHLLCLPTYYPYEGQPLCLIEAQAAGCVLMTCDQGGVRDVFEPGVNGYEVAQRSAKAIEEALLQVLDERARLPAIALHNRQHAEEYRESRYHEGMLNLCAESATKPISSHRDT